MKKRAIVSVVSLGLAASVFVWAHDEKDMKMMQKPGSPEFEQIKQLAGKWTGMKEQVGQNKPAENFTTQFKVTSNGSAVEETLGPGTPQEMVDMYTDEKGRLAMTHYCAIGNQPHMVLRESGPHLISLETGPMSTIQPNEMHMHSLTLEIQDANHLTERWISYQNGKPGDTAIFKFARVK